MTTKASTAAPQGTHTPQDIEALRWYLDRGNHGRGRLHPEASRLLRIGLLRQSWTSFNDWVLTLSARGRAVLAAQGGAR